MLYTISGTVSYVFENKVIITASNIGFEITSPHTKTFQTQQTITLFVHMHWSQEQGPSLFGFLNSIEKEVFLMIISCSGIGPKLGIALLEALSAQDFLQIICQENSAALSAIKGVGTKKAEQLILNLKEKAHKLAIQNPSNNTTFVSAWIDLQQTLISLNYTPVEIKQATSMLKEQVIEQNISFDLLLRKALTLLAKK